MTRPLSAILIAATAALTFASCGSVATETPEEPAAASTRIATGPSPRLKPAKCGSLRRVPRSVASPILTAIPGSGVCYGRHSRRTLEIVLPINVTPPSGSSLHRAFVYSDIGWKAKIASAAIRTSGIATYKVVYSDHTSPRAAFDDFHGTVGTSQGAEGRIGQMDTITEKEAEKQLQSNLTTLRSALPKGGLIRGQMALIPINTKRNQFALEAEVVIAKPSDLTGHLGDVVDGLDTGLENHSGSLIEGFATVATTKSGSPLVGAWAASRAASGTLDFAPTLRVPDSFGPTVHFPNLSGGPQAPSTAIGGEAGAAS